MLTLETIYKAILETGWLTTNERGEVLRNLSSATNKESVNEPFIMLEKQVALPTRENLGRSGRDNLLIFHPLMEGLVGGESPVIGKLRRAYGIRATFSGASIFKYLLAGATHTTEYSKFSPSQTRLFKFVSDINEKTLKLWDKIVSLSTERNGASNAFVDVYTKRNAVLNGRPYSRVTSVRFPIYEELIRSDGKIFDKELQLNKTDRKNFIAIFEFAFENIAKKDAYSVGTNSRIAPYLDALLGAYGKIFETLNSLYDEYSPVIVMDENLRVELDWLDWFTDIESLKSIAQTVQQQYGNYSVKIEDEKREITGSKGDDRQYNHKEVAPVSLGVAIEPKQNKEIMYSEGVAQPHLEKRVFQGIGKPLPNANGVVVEKEQNLKANIINGAGVNNGIDSQRVNLEATVKQIRQSGISTVSATSAHVVNPVVNNGFPNPQFGGGQINEFQQPNNNGWSNSPINNQPQNPYGNMTAPMMIREEMVRKMIQGPGSFVNTNIFNNGSVV